MKKQPLVKRMAQGGTMGRYYTTAARTVLGSAQTFARQRGDEFVFIDAFTAAIVRLDSLMTKQLVVDVNNEVVANVNGFFALSRKDDAPFPKLSPVVTDLLVNAEKEAESLSHDFIGIGHYLLALYRLSERNRGVLSPIKVPYSQARDMVLAHYRKYSVALEENEKSSSLPEEVLQLKDVTITGRIGEDVIKIVLSDKTAESQVFLNGELMNGVRAVEIKALADSLYTDARLSRVKPEILEPVKTA